MRTCRQCQEALQRKRFNGRLEDKKIFERRQYCNRRYMAQWMTGRMKVANDKNSRRQAARFVTDKCAKCGVSRGSRLIVHHLDENPQNNTPSNLMTLCGSCHARAHSHNYTEIGKRRLPCLHCNKPSYRQGLCGTHLSRLKRYGHALAKMRKIGCEWLLMLHVGNTWLPFPSQAEPPRAWDVCAGTVTPSVHRSPKRSSKARSTT